MMSESLGYFERFAELLGVSPEVGQSRFSSKAISSPRRSQKSGRISKSGLRASNQWAWPTLSCWMARKSAIAGPGSHPTSFCGAFRQRDGWIDGCKAAALFAHAAKAPILFGTTVLEIERDGSRVTGVRTDRGTIASDTVVLTAGPFSGPLAGEPLPIAPLRRQRVIVAAHPAIPQHGPMTIDANTGAHWRPTSGRALMAWAQPETTSDPVFPVPPRPGYVDLILNDCNGVQRLAPFWNELVPSLPTDAISTRPVNTR